MITGSTVRSVMHTDRSNSFKGGSTRYYGGLSVSSSKQLLDEKYPVGWKHDDLLPYFKKSEDHFCHYRNSTETGISLADCIAYHGKNGPMEINPTYWNVSNVTRDLRYGCQELGIPFTSDYNSGDRHQSYGITQFFRKLANRTDPASTPSLENAWTGYMDQGIIERGNLMIAFDATVEAILFREKHQSNPEAYGVSVMISGKRYQITARKEIVLSAGVYDTPKILQLSGIGNAALLEQYGIHVVVNNSFVGGISYARCV